MLLTTYNLIIRVARTVTKFIKSITLSITVWFLVACSDDIIQEPSIKNPTAAQILGNPNYPAFSYGGYRGKSRQVAPSQEQLIEDLKILSAMGVKVLRTYNTSQFPLAPDLLAAITVLKNADPNFEMYVMLGAWVEAQGSWRHGTDHHKGDIEKNTAEIETAVALANEYPDIVKVIAVGNEAMVQWAVNYFVYPKTILKWVNYLQKLKSTGQLNSDIWITSSDNYESWGGGSSVYHTKDLVSLINAVDYLSVHTYPYHDSFYNQDYWGVLPAEEGLSKQEMIKATMKRAVEYAQSQYQGVADYVTSLGIDKPIHIGEAGWASADSAAYGVTGSKASDEYKQNWFYHYMREWTDQAGMSLFYFEVFDERWKDISDGGGSENHFGLIRLNNEVKYTLWDLVDDGSLSGLTRDNRPLVKSYGGDLTAMLDEVLNPPFKSTMPVRKITSVNDNLTPGQVITANTYVVSNTDLDPSASTDMTYPSAILKLIPWEGTVAIQMSPQGIIEIVTRTSDWWGTSLEFQADVGENLSQFKSGYLHFDIRGDNTISFNIGFQTGRFLNGDQINSLLAFGRGTNYPVSDEWRRYKLPISLFRNNSEMVDVTGILSLLSQSPGNKEKIYIKNIYYTQE